MKYKKLFLLLWLTVSAMMGFAQTQLSLAERAMRNDTGVMVFSRKVDNRMLIALILNKQTGVLSVIDRYMHPVDSVKMAPGDYDDLVHHRLDAFDYYTRQKKYKIEFRISIINQLRFRGKVYPNGDAYNYVVNQEFPELKRTDSAHIVSNIQLLEHDNNADSTLLWLLKLDDPITLDGHQIYTKIDHYKPGDHFSRGDSLFFVNSDPFSHLHLAILTKKNPHMFYYNRDKQCVAWYTIKPELVDELSKQDVFSYYLEFLEISKQSIYKKINALYLEKRPTIHLVSNAKPLKERIAEAEKQEELIDRKLDYAIYPDFKSYATILKANFPNVSVSRDEAHWCNFLGIIPVDNGGHSDGIAGDTRYELKDWRDNVVATISNRRYQASTDGRTVDHYEPDVLTAQDYYAFGAPMPGRSYNAGTYRYGYNGKENDDEITGIGNLQDYGMREYDTQLGRFLSVDPLSAKYPGLTPYQFASNNPIAGVDQDGLEFVFYNTQQVTKNGTALLRVTGAIKESSPVIVRTMNNGIPSPDIHINIENLGIQLNFVEYKGNWVTIPKGFSAKNLPPVNSPAWEETQSYSEIQENFNAAVTILSLVDVSSIKNSIGKVEEKMESLATLRARAVRQAWKEERALVRETGTGTVDWTDAEKDELLNSKKGTVTGYEGHHINSVNGSEDLAGDPNNIKFVKGRAGNLTEHGGNFQNPTTGDLLDRKQMIEDAKKPPGS